MGEPIMFGFTRKVYISQDYVIKIARNRFGMKANIKELMRFSKYGSTYLCPITDHGFSWIRMPRVSIPPVRERMRYARTLRKALKHTGISDIHFYNIGELNGRPVLYDYGDPWFPVWIFTGTIRKLRRSRNDN